MYIKNLFVLTLLCLMIFRINARTFDGQPFAHTFSIVAIDEKAGQMGVAVQSHWFSVGSVVSWGEAGVGVVATQSLVNVSFGKRGLDLMKSGKSAEQALEELLATDEGRAFRQVAIIDADGNIASHTGEKCIEDAGHVSGENFSVQANMMLNKKVVPAMAAAFKVADGPLAERMVAALKAAQDAGGDIRGQQSAAILVVKLESTGKVWEDRLIDLRVEDHPDAVDEIARILKVHRAYEFMNKGDLAIEKGDEAAALKYYGAAQKMFPENPEMKYWHAVSLANIGRIKEALPLFKTVFEKDKNWIELTRRIEKNGLLVVKKNDYEKIINLLE